MRPFDFVQPKSLEEALAAYEDGAAFLGGGTNLLDLMKVGVETPGKVIDITRLPGLSTIEEDGAGLRIGAMVRNSDVARHEAVRTRFPAVAEALRAGASGQLRNSATVGGNLLQKPRCAYFMHPTSACNLRHPGAGCDAKEGVSDHMAILGQSETCIAVNPSDFCVPLAALGAMVEIAGKDGTREIALTDFHGETTALEPGEIITHLRLPADGAAFAGNARYLKVRDRTSYAFALVSCAAMLRMDGDTIAEARIALGGVALKPWRAAKAEALLAGATSEAFARAAEAALEGAAPSTDNGWKIELARRTVVRALTLAARGTPKQAPALPASVFSAEGAPIHA